MIPHSYQPLSDGVANRAATRAAIRFLLDLWDYDQDAYTFVGTRRDGRWRDHPIRGDREAQLRIVLAAHSADRFDLYFCPNAFAKPHRKSAHALPTRYALCDIDDADPARYDPSPNILWQTSPGRFQGIWIWRKWTKAHIAEQYSRNIWAKDGGDKGGWSITKMLRLPGTINHKPEYQTPVITLQSYDGRPQKLPRSLTSIAPGNSRASIGHIAIANHDPEKIMRRYRRGMGLQAGTLMTARGVMRTDRSGAVYLIIVGMIGAGAQDSEIAAVLLVNPYFTAKWGTDLPRAKDQISRIRTRMEVGQ